MGKSRARYCMAPAGGAARGSTLVQHGHATRRRFRYGAARNSIRCAEGNAFGLQRADGGRRSHETSSFTTGTDPFQRAVSRISAERDRYCAGWAISMMLCSRKPMAAAWVAGRPRSRAGNKASRVRSAGRGSRSAHAPMARRSSRQRQQQVAFGAERTADQKASPSGADLDDFARLHAPAPWSAWRLRLLPGSR